MANKKTVSFSDEERAAMRERALELKVVARLGKDRKAGEQMVLAKINQMPEPDRSMAKKIHEIVTTNAPNFLPRTWYGMPAYANKDGKVVCFFQAASKFKARYASFGFNDPAMLDEGNMWPIYFAIQKLGPAEETRIAGLVKKAIQ